jgi:ABC-type Fe3+/spermidine/putrescine transport system ATPase subunit
LIEIGATDRVVVLDGGRVVRQGVPAEVYADPQSESAAMATGDVNILPVAVGGNVVESVIGAWDVAAPAFQGSGIALVRPGDFTLAGPGEESDLIFGVEEACFYDGAWHVRGLLSDAFMLRVTLPGGIDIHKGKLMGLRYDPTRFRLLAKE